MVTVHSLTGLVRTCGQAELAIKKTPDYNGQKDVQYKNFEMLKKS